MNASYKLKCEKECLILDILLQHIVFSKKKISNTNNVNCKSDINAYGIVN